MCVLAGELSDGFVCHPTNSHPDILTARTLPALAEGVRTAGRNRAPAVVANPQPMMAATRHALDEQREPRRAELAFLYSTPAYRRQLEDFGLAEVGEALSEMAHRREWGDLANHLSDEVMNRVVPQGTYQEMPDILGSGTPDSATASACLSPPTTSMTLLWLNLSNGARRSRRATLRN